MSEELTDNAAIPERPDNRWIVRYKSRVITGVWEESLFYQEENARGFARDAGDGVTIQEFVRAASSGEVEALKAEIDRLRGIDPDVDVQDLWQKELPYLFRSWEAMRAENESLKRVCAANQQAALDLASRPSSVWDDAIEMFETMWPSGSQTMFSRSDIVAALTTARDAEWVKGETK